MRCIDFDLPIIIDTFQNYARLTGCTVEQLSPDKTLEDGYTIIGNDIFIILYNGDVPYDEHTNWTLAHEVGHIYLGHKTDGALQEVEAHWFAAELLSPESVILAIVRGKVRVDYTDLQYLFGISFTAATKRMDSLSRSTVQLAYKEKEIVQKYHNIINEYISKFRCIEA